MADDDRNQAGYQSSPPVPSWSPNPHVYPHSHHNTPAQEWSGFNFGSMEPGAFGSHAAAPHRPVHQQLQPLVMPQWPSMLNSSHQTSHQQPTYHASYQPMYLQPVQPIQPMSISQVQTPVSATSSRSTTGPSTTTPRRTLTDQDRKRMCQYAEEHPNSKQTEIGAIFGVERSTVSKVLRQKEKYLVQDEGSRSPIKRAKGRSPDIERALAVWAKNQEKRGLPLTDDLIRDKARAFVATTANPESHHTLSSSWIEKFKLKNNLMGARSRKGSLLPSEADSASVVASSSHTPNDNSPTSADGSGSPSSTDLRDSKSRENLKHETSSEIYIEWARHGSIASQSASSMNSAFHTDASHSTFSPGPLSPTSPFYTPDSGTAPGEFVPPLSARVDFSQAQISANMYRPRSQTFPLLPQLDAYMAGSSGPEAITPKYIAHCAEGLDSPMAEISDPMTNMDDSVAPDDMSGSRALSPTATMRPPPLPAHVTDGRRGSTPGTSTSSLHATSPDEARRAMEVVLNFFEQQPKGFLDINESMAVSKLVEKLRLHARADSMSH